MADTSQTVADGLRYLFARLHSAIPPNSPNETMFATWQRVLGADSPDNLIIVARIGVFSAAVSKLEAQIKASHDLDGSMKADALSTVGLLKVFFRVDLFGSLVAQYKGNCSPNICGRIGMIGRSLQSEFSEPKLLKATVDEVSGLLLEVVTALDDPSVPLDLRLNLQRHIRAMQWWLANFEIASAQDLIETIGSAVVISKQIEQRASDNGAPTEASKIASNRLGKAAVALGKLVGLFPNIVESADRIATDGQHLFDTLHLTGAPPT